MRQSITAVMASIVAVALLSFSGTGLLSAAEPDAGADRGSPASALPPLEERISRLQHPGGATEDLALPEAPDPAALDGETAREYRATLQAYYAYRRSGYEHRLAVFEWQFLSTKIIFVVVLILVFAGIYFAAIQFHHGLGRKTGSGDESTEFVFSLKEFKVRSPVLGVIVLTLSLAFFYLYLVYVYPIQNVF